MVSSRVMINMIISKILKHRKVVAWSHCHNIAVKSGRTGGRVPGEDIAAGPETSQGPTIITVIDAVIIRDSVAFMGLVHALPWIIPS
jgi:hypothetical protein